MRIAESESFAVAVVISRLLVAAYPTERQLWKSISKLGGECDNVHIPLSASEFLNQTCVLD